MKNQSKLQYKRQPAFQCIFFIKAQVQKEDKLQAIRKAIRLEGIV